MQNSTFKSATVEVEKNAKFYVFSDGVYEVTKGSGEVMSLDEFVDELSAESRNGMSKVESMMAFAQDVQGTTNLEDDFSLCEIIFK